MEKGVCGDGGGRGEAAQRVAGGEPAAQEAGGRSGIEDLVIGGSQRKKVVSPSARRRAARYLVEGKKCSTNRACQALGLTKSTYYRKVRRAPGGRRLEKRIVGLSRKHPRYGYRMITELL